MDDKMEQVLWQLLLALIMRLGAAAIDALVQAVSDQPAEAQAKFIGATVRALTSRQAQTT
jgi:hypothetical protein